MAWFLNYYECGRCKLRWHDAWSCMCDDECPDCGERDMLLFDSQDLTEVIEQDGTMFVVLRSPDTAEHSPDYQELGRFGTRAQALNFLASSD